MASWSGARPGASRGGTSGRERPSAAWTIGFLAALLIGLVWGLPRLEPLRPSKILAAWVRDNAPRDVRLMAVEYQEPSLVFYWGDQVIMTGRNEWGEGIARLNQVEKPIALVTTEDRWLSWLDRAESHVNPSVSVRYEGRFYLFQRGRWERMVIVGNW